MSFSSFLREKFLVGGAPQPLKIPPGTRRLLNLFLYALQSRFRPVSPRYYPLTLMIEVSAACNLACPRCERQTTNKSNLGKLTSLETIEKITPILPYVYSVYLVAGLGEGFLNPDFWSIVKILKKTGVKVGYFTNGVLLNKENIDKTFTERIDSVLISFDSLKKENFEKIRKGANFEKIVENVKSLLAERKRRGTKNLSIGINFAAQKSTIEEMPEIVRFAKSIGLDFIYFTTLIAHKKEFIPECLFDFDKNRLQKVFSETKRLAERLGVSIRLPGCQMESDGYCPHLWREMIIFGNGDVSPCPHFRQPKKYYFTIKNRKIIQKEITFPSLIVGNVYKDPILGIWNNRKYQNLRRNFKKGSLDSPCRFCYFRFGLH